MSPRSGGIGRLEEGNLKGRRFIIPAEVLVEQGVYLNGSPHFAKACIIHHKFIPTAGCQDCQEDLKKNEALAKAIGL